MKRLDNLHNRLWFNKLVYDENGTPIGTVNRVIPKRLFDIYYSQIEFWDESKRNIEWVECPFCGLRKRQLNHHLRAFHPNEDFEGIRQHAINSSGIGFISMWKRKWANLSKEDAIVEYQKFRKSHGMNKGWGCGENNNNHHSNTTIKERKEKSPRCIEFWVRKGYSIEEAKILRENWYQEIFEQMVPPASIERWIERFGNEELAKEKRREAYGTNNLERYIDRFGKEEGTKRFTERLKSWANKMKDLSAHGCSQKELDFIQTIISTFNLEQKDCQYRGQYSSLRYVGNLPDFIYKNSKVIEFYGDYWHCNPKLYDNEFVNKAGYSVKSRAQKDAIRNKTLTDNGYEVLVIWEYDWREHRKECLQQIKTFLNCQL